MVLRPSCRAAPDRRGASVRIPKRRNTLRAPPKSPSKATSAPSISHHQTMVASMSEQKKDGCGGRVSVMAFRTKVRAKLICDVVQGFRCRVWRICISLYGPDGEQDCFQPFGNRRDRSGWRLSTRRCGTRRNFSGFAYAWPVWTRSDFIVFVLAMQPHPICTWRNIMPHLEAGPAGQLDNIGQDSADCSSGRQLHDPRTSVFRRRAQNAQECARM